MELQLAMRKHETMRLIVDEHGWLGWRWGTAGQIDGHQFWTISLFDLNKTPEETLQRWNLQVEPSYWIRWQLVRWTHPVELNSLLCLLRPDKQPSNVEPAYEDLDHPLLRLSWTWSYSESEGSIATQSQKWRRTSASTMLDLHTQGQVIIIIIV